MNGDVHVRICESRRLRCLRPLTHEKYDLDFALLADEGHAVADAYGVWAEKSMYRVNP